MMRKANLLFGIVLFLAFLGTGYYMSRYFKPEHVTDLTMRMQIRASHIYLLFTALLNIMAFTCELRGTGRARKFFDPAFRLFLIAAGTVALCAFAFEHTGDLKERKLTLLSVILALASVGFILIHEILTAMRQHLFLSSHVLTMEKPIAVNAGKIEARQKKSIYPAPFAAMMALREKRVLGDLFGLTNFGVNLTTIQPGGMSALRHAHATQDEFIYIVSGNPVLVTNEGETQLSPGMCAGFLHGNGNAHNLINREKTDAVYLEIGDRSAGDAVLYPDNDLMANFEGPGNWRFTHKDGSPY